MQPKYSRRNCIRVSGLKEVDGENLDDVITDLARELQVDIDLSDVDKMYHLNRRKPSAQSQATPPRPRDCIVNSQGTARGKKS